MLCPTLAGCKSLRDVEPITIASSQSRLCLAGVHHVMPLPSERGVWTLRHECTPHGNFQLLGVDGPRPIGVKQVKGFSNLLFLLLGQACGAIRSLG